MKYTHSINDRTAELSLRGKFTFADNKTLLSFLEDAITQNYAKIIIDLQGVDFIDSAGLGVLLLARDKCGKASIELVLLHPMGQVKQMFKLSKFTELFYIQD